MRRSFLRRLPSATALAVALVLIVAGGTLFQRSLVSSSTYLLKVPTEDASGLYPGSDVMIAGAPAGTVQNITLGQGGVAVVTASIDATYAPVHRDATVSIRPKSLLGEMYVALDPGQAAATLASGASLPRLQVNRSTDLQQVVSTFDTPTRDKLQTAIVELGGGVMGRGENVNQGIQYGNQDLNDLAGIADTLAQRDQQLQAVIQSLNVVLSELARSDRREELGLLIRNTDLLLQNLVQQEQQIKEALSQTNAALARFGTGLNGTGASLATIFSALPTTVQQGNLILAGLSADSDTLLPNMDSLVQGIQYGPVVFGGRDAGGYATRISLVLGCASINLCPQLTGPLAQLPLVRSLPAVGTQVGAQPPASAPSSGSTDNQLIQQGLLGFLLGGSSS
jgi:virulence factor Mce-like protein